MYIWELSEQWYILTKEKGVDICVRDNAVAGHPAGQGPDGNIYRRPCAANPVLNIKDHPVQR